jgi:serine/threonine protein phosphatase PrpC
MVGTMIKAAGFSDPGQTREGNQDSLYYSVFNEDDLPIGIFVIADGIGGLSDGKEASLKTVEAFQDWCEANVAGKKDLDFLKGENALAWVQDEWTGLVDKVNQEIYTHAAKKGIRSGTTLIALLILGDRYLIAHAGDSRLYQVNFFDLTALTEDHTLSVRSYKAGLITEHELLNYKGSDPLTVSVGTSEKCSVTFSKGTLSQKRMFFLCSDGVYKFIPRKKLHRILRRGKSIGLDECLAKLKKTIYETGAGDNLTGILVQLV